MKKKSTSQSAFFSFRVLFGAALCVAALAVALFAQGSGVKRSQQVAPRRTPRDAPGTQRPDIVRMVGPVRLDQDLRNLPYIAPKEEFEERALTRYPHGTNSTAAPSGYPQPTYVQTLLKNMWRPTPTMPPPLLTFDGETAAQACACAPPDSDGDVGPNHYVEAINVAFRVFDKTNGNPLSPVVTYNSFFAPLTGTPCANANDGDPFVMYDAQADRWVISDFAFPSFPGTSFYQCIGVSQTGDPVSGGWFLYALQVDPANPTFLGDYPKFSLWNDGGTQNAYFLMMNLFSNPTTFNGVRAYALDRASMLSGGPANAIGFTLSAADVGASYSFVPATFRTGSPPPTGRDGMVLCVDSPASNPTTLTQVHARFFHVDFANPANATFGVGPTHQPNAEITVNSFVEAWTNTNGFSIVPQQGVSQLIDTLGDKIMTPVVYQNLGGTESLWAVQTIMLNFPSGPTAIRWYQFDVTGGNFPATAAQQQDWSNNNDGVWRFMPSIAVDASGNVAIGYSSSSPSLHPGMRYAGRLVSDPPNDLPQGEAIMFTGNGSESGTNRWGDYSMTTVDPSDGMTFWHVNEYEPTTGAFNWATRIGKFNFVGGGPTPTPTPPPLCSWSAGPNLPNPPMVLIRAVGVFFPDDGNFYSVGGRTSDTAGSDFQHVLQYNPGSNSWTQMGVTLPDNQMNNMACGVLNQGGTDYIYCVGGSAAGQTTATARVFRYNPLTDTVETLDASDNWPGNAAGTILPGGFAVANDKLYILGGFNINVASTNEIWEFDPNAPQGARWTQKVNTPVGIMYAPTCTINGIIYVGGASDFQNGTVIDTTNSFSFDPVGNSIGTIAPIPRATGETRALNFCNLMYVIGGGRVAPNPSNEVDIYDPVSDSWSVGIPFTNPRRNFPTDTDGTNNIWLAGGYEPTTPTGDMEIFNCPTSPCAAPTPTPTPTATPTATPTPTPTPTPRLTPTPRPRGTPRPRPTP